jgi:ribosomal protein S18 acetylase RimI-like enzyme
MLSQPSIGLFASRFDQQDWTTHVIARPSWRPAIVTATLDDEKRCIEIITRAFADDPAARWMYPDRNQFLRYFPQFVRIFGGAAFEHGTVQLLYGCAAALWLPPEAHPDEAALAELIERSVSARQRHAVLAVFEQMDYYHPREPHWHLPLIGVEPSHQRKGYGSALLASTLARLDDQDLPAYLEATSPDNVALYERHGFEVVGVVQAGTSPSIFPMLRKPCS